MDIKIIKNNGIRILVLGDIHLGDQTNKTNYIVNSLKLFFKKHYELLVKVDYIVVNGDLFEKALLSYSSEYIQSMEWIFQLVLFCSKNNIKLRLLEGTPSHDNNQGKLLVNLISQWEVPVNFKYIPEIEIEYDSDFDVNMLYVPDRNDKTAKDRFKIIKRMMLDLNIDKVDFAFMHGNFTYQLPMISEHAHNEDDYLEIVRFYIFINHIHTPSVYDRIIAPGSFDRMIHGEEEDKGCIYAEVKSFKDMRFIFLKNENARIFKTFRIDNDVTNIEKLLKNLHKDLSKLPVTSFIRILTKNKLNISKVIKEKYNFEGVKEEKLKDNKPSVSNLFTTNNDITELHITKDNIIDLLKVELGDINPEYFSIIKTKIETINKNYAA